MNILKKAKIVFSSAPNWLIHVSWAVSGMFATGAAWYFLSVSDQMKFGLAVAGAMIFGVIAVKLQIIKDRRIIPKYCGKLDHNFAAFIYKYEASVFRLEVQLDEMQSSSLISWLGIDEPVIWLGVVHDDYGTEFGFHRNDTEVHWNTRFSDSVHTEGYFKVHSIQGPYQGWMSLTLRGVGKEHVIF